MLRVSYCDSAVFIVNFLPCARCRGYCIFSLMKFGQNVCLDEISDEFENGSYGSVSTEIFDWVFLYLFVGKVCFDEISD